MSSAPNKDNIIRSLQRKLTERKNFSKIFYNTAWLLADKLIRLGLGFVTSILVAVYLGPDQFGLYNYALAFTGIFGSIAGFSMGNIAIRNIVKHEDLRYEVLGTVCLIQSLTGFLTTLIAAGIIYLIEGGTTIITMMVLIIASGYMLRGINVIIQHFASLTQHKFTLFASTTGFVISAFIKLYLVHTEASLTYFALAVLSEVLITQTGLLIVYKAKGYGFAKWKVNFKVGSSMFKDAWPLLLSALAIIVYMRIDQIMLKEMVGAAETGIYSVAVRLTEAWYFIPTAITTSLFPTIVKYKSSQPRVFEYRMQQFFNFMSFIAWFICIGMCIFSPIVVPLLFGAEYVQSVPILYIIIWSLFFTNLGVARSSYFVSMNWTKVLFWSTLSAMLINILLNFILIPFLHAKGAAIATVISYWFASHGSCFLFSKTRKAGVMILKSVFYPKFW